MDLLELMQTRRSIREYTGAPIPEALLEQILQAGLLSASGRSIRPWALIVVRDKAMLARLSESRVGSAKMLAGADAAIVVVADTAATDVWIEDCAIVMTNMQLMAHSLGVGSCWIQGRLRTAPEGGTTEACLRELLGFPEGFALAATLSLGMPAKRPAGRALTELPMDKIHREAF